jgi:tetratricopeptide (TPR) repeat protein
MVLDDAAIAAADRAIGADPTVTNAYVQKGYALFRKAEQADDADAAYAAAMAPFEALNALETDHTQPLIYYYRSFTRRGITPTEDARFAIERATQLAPFDKNLALEVAVMKAGEGQSTIARYLLAPVAADPHGGSRAATARDMIAFLETVPDGRRVAFKDLEVGGDKEGDADEGGDEGEEGES